MISEEAFNEAKNHLSLLKEYIIFARLNINVVTS
jgi:hypothetical protein